MKTLIMVVAMLAASVSFASSDTRDKQQAAEKLFDSMTASQAIASKSFTKRYWNNNLPGTSTWMGPGNICITGNSVQTIVPMTVCTEWRVNLKEDRFGKDYKSFAYQGQANSYAEDSSNAQGSPYCVDSFKKAYSHPLKWQVEGCVLWAVKRKDSTPRTFKTEASADNYAEESSNAQGQAYCVQEGTINRSFGTVFKVDFFRKTAGDKYDNKKMVGSHSYTYQSCDYDDLTPVPAN